MQGNGILILSFVCIAIALGASVRHLLRRSAIPYSVVLLLLGLAVGVLARFTLPESSTHAFALTMDLIANMDPHLILFLFLPALIFESAFAMDTHLFKRMFSQICLLAIPGLLIATALTALFSLVAMPWQWSWPIALMFGALVSATDPVAVVALLKEQSSRKRMETLIEGESLLNDGTAIVVFTLFYSLAIASQLPTEGSQVQVTGVLMQFVWVVSLGVFIGAALGWLCIHWLQRIFNDEILEIVITLTAAYLAFIVAEGLFHVSGIVAVVTLGVIFASAGKTRFSPEVQHSLHHFWQVLSYLFNTLIFLIVGILIGERVELQNGQYWWNLALLYVAVQIIRLVSILVLMPLLKRWGVGITREKASVLIWGGLRGAVALALALAVAQTDSLPLVVREQILFLTSGLVVLSILINGGSMRYLMVRLGLDKLPPAKQAAVDKTRALARIRVNKLVTKLRNDPYFKFADWQPIENQYGSNTVAKASEQDMRPPKIEADCSEAERHRAFLRQLLEAEKQHYWQQFKDGLLMSKGLTLLDESVQTALDGEPCLDARQQLFELWPAFDSPKTESWFKMDSPSSHFDHLVALYNAGQGFSRSQEFLLSQLEALAPDKASHDQARDAINHNLIDIKAKLNAMEEQAPAQARAVQTYIARRLLLGKERHAIGQLSEQGIIEMADGEKLIKHIEQQMQALQDSGVGSKPTASSRLEIKSNQIK